MIASPETEAEILKLAQLLDRDPGRLSYLARLPAPELRSLREQITETLFSSQESALRRLAAASRLLPVGVLASIGENAFGPTLSAGIAGLLEPDRAVEVASRMPTEFLAQVAIELDPRRAGEVIAGIPPERIFEITAELARLEQYVTMGRFVGHLSDEALSAAVRALDDGALSRTLFVMEGEQDRVAALLDEWRRPTS